MFSKSSSSSSPKKRAYNSYNNRKRKFRNWFSTPFKSEIKQVQQVQQESKGKSSSSSPRIRIRKRYGVIGFYLDQKTKTIFYVFGQKRWSIGYLELLLGHFQLNDLGLLVRLIEDTTTEERNKILNQNYEDLYVEFQGRPIEDLERDKFQISKMKFERLRKGFRQNHYFYSWETLIQGAKSRHDKTSKEFPKGRKKIIPGKEESNFDCALREFEEETHCSVQSYVLIPYTPPFIMKIHGMDGCMYEN